MEFPSNSIHKGTENVTASTEEKPATGERFKQVAKSKEPRKPLGLMAKEVFVSGGRNFAEHVIQEVIIPSLQDMAMDALKDFSRNLEGALGRAFNRTTRRTDGPLGSSQTTRPTNYGGFSKRTTTTTTRREETRPTSRHSNVIERRTLESKEKAERVLKFLDNKISDIGACTVGDYYDLIGIKPRQTDDDWGWADLEEAYVTKINRMEWEIIMPDPLPLDD